MQSWYQGRLSSNRVGTINLCNRLQKCQQSPELLRDTISSRKCIAVPERSCTERDSSSSDQDIPAGDLDFVVSQWTWKECQQLGARARSEEWINTSSVGAHTNSSEYDDNPRCPKGPEEVSGNCDISSESRMYLKHRTHMASCATVASKTFRAIAEVVLILGPSDGNPSPNMFLRHSCKLHPCVALPLELDVLIAWRVSRTS